MDDDRNFPLFSLLVAESMIFNGQRRPWPFRRTDFPPWFLLTALLNKTYTFHSRPQDYDFWIDSFRYLEEDYFRLFRLTKLSCQKLVNILMTEGQLTIVWTQGKEPVSPEKMVHVALRYLSSQQTLRQIGDVFNLADSTVHSIRDKVCRALARIKTNLITWPNIMDAEILATKFKAIAGFPNVIGAIDGSHIPCKVREVISDDYINRKMFHSIILQGICTSEKLFTNVSIGCPGRMHDSRVLRWSNLRQKVDHAGPASLFYDSYHLLGDSAYATESWLLSPYKATRALDWKKTNYNFIHSKTRVCIENSFGLLKNRWRRLQHVNVYNTNTVSPIVLACCVLHNFCLLEEDFFENVYGTEANDQDFPENVAALERDDQEGVRKRDAIAELLAQA